MKYNRYSANLMRIDEIYKLIYTGNKKKIGFYSKYFDEGTNINIILILLYQTIIFYIAILISVISLACIWILVYG